MRKGIRRALLALLLVGVVLSLGSLVAQADPAAQGVDPYFNTHLGPVPEKPLGGGAGESGSEGGLLDWSGIDWGPWLDGLTGAPWMALIVALAGLGFIFTERSGVPKRLWAALASQFNTSWGLARRTKAGWLFTEFLRRSALTMAGAVLWVGKQIVAIPGMVKDLFNWMGRGTAENFSTLVAFFRADRRGKSQIVLDLIDEARSNWEIAKALPGLFWEDIRTRWSRGWTGLVRMWTDPNVSNGELLQWGADHVSMGADASVVGAAVGAVARGVKGASWFRKLNLAGKVQEALVIARVARSSGIPRATTGAAFKVLRAADQEVRLSQIVSSLSRTEQDLLAYLLQKGVFQVEGGVLRMTSGRPQLASLASAVDAMPPVEARYQLLLNGAPGYNITPKRITRAYSRIGRNGTFLTDARAVEEIIGPIPADAHRIRITPGQARELEQALGLREYSLGRQNELFILDGIPTRNPRRPLPADGNEFFLGEGKGLPGGGPEVLVDSIPSRGGPGIRRVFLEVTSR